MIMHSTQSLTEASRSQSTLVQGSLAWYITGLGSVLCEDVY